MAKRAPFCFPVLSLSVDVIPGVLSSICSPGSPASYILTDLESNYTYTLGTPKYSALYNDISLQIYGTDYMSYLQSCSNQNFNAIPYAACFAGYFGLFYPQAPNVSIPVRPFLNVSMLLQMNRKVLRFGKRGRCIRSQEYPLRINSSDVSFLCLYSNMFVSEHLRHTSYPVCVFGSDDGWMH
jgi:hypothetical protein